MNKSSWINTLVKQLEYKQSMMQDSDLRENMIKNPQLYQEKLGIDPSLEVVLVEETESTYHIPVPYIEGNLEEEVQIPSSLQPIVDFLLKAAIDTSFREKLKENPSGVMQENFPVVTWWDTLEVKIVEDTDSKCHLIIPALEESVPLSDEELEMIAGGVTLSTPTFCCQT